MGRCSRGGLPGIPRACDRCDSSPDLWGFCHSARIWGFPFSLCRCEGQNHKPKRRLQFLIGSGFPLFYEPVAFKSCLISILVSCLWPEGRRGKDRKSNCKAESLLSQVLMRSFLPLTLLSTAKAPTNCLNSLRATFDQIVPAAARKKILNSILLLIFNTNNHLLQSMGLGTCLLLGATQGS